MEAPVARTLDGTARALSRDAILDVAEQLIRTKGCERMSIQDVQDELGVSRGAIYHYFRSKAALVEAVVARAGDAIVGIMGPIVEDPAMSAATKLRATFEAGGRWKGERRDLMLALLRSWYSDDNVIVRDHLSRLMTDRVAPLLAAIIRQGIAESTMRVSSAEQAAAVITALLVASGDRTGRLFLDRLAGRIPFEEVQSAIAAYDEAVERILGLPTGSFRMIDEPSLRFWFA
jgi:AcrR family transcriptional regulator